MTNLDYTEAVFTRNLTIPKVNQKLSFSLGNVKLNFLENNAELSPDQTPIAWQISSPLRSDVCRLPRCRPHRRRPSCHPG